MEIYNRIIDMKKIILLALIVLIMTGCNERTPDATYISGGTVYKTYVIDSCEYFGKLKYGRTFLSHKGNCRFCKERRQKEMKELIKALKEE